MNSAFAEYVDEQLYHCVLILAESNSNLPVRVTIAVECRLSRIFDIDEESDIPESIKNRIEILKKLLNKSAPYKETIESMNEDQIREIIVEIIDLSRAVTDFIGANYHC